MDTSIYSDPVKVGPGIWFSMHINAVKATTNELKSAFVIYINAVCDNFKCKKCQTHFRKFIETHPFDNYWDIRDINGKDIGFFKWTWELHNQVNKFLDKYQPTLEEAYNFYSSSEMGACFNCTSHPDEPKEEPRTLAVPEILVRYIEEGNITPKPFKLIPRF